MNPPSPNPAFLLKRLAAQLRPCWPHLAAIFLLSLFAPPLALLTPLPLKIAFDNVIDTHPLPRWLAAFLPAGTNSSTTALVILVLALTVSVALLTQVREYLSALLSAYTGEKVLRAFRAQLFHHVQRLSLGYHDTKGTADSVYRIQYDAMSINSLAVDGVVPFFTSALTFSAMLYVTARINWRLALVALGISPLLLFFSRLYRHRLRAQAREVKRIDSAAMAVVQEALAAVRVVKAFAQEPREEQRFIQRSSQGMQARIRMASLEGSFGVILVTIIAIGMGAVLLIGINAIRAGTSTRGELLLVMGYLAQLYTPLKTMSKKMATLQGHIAGVERAFALLDEPHDVIERPHPQTLKRASGAVAFHQVCFAYQNNRTVLDDISFAIEPGTCLGIAGTTGAGKTTLVSLLMRFYDPTAGHIQLDGTDLREYKLSDLRNQFAIVLQEPVLFSTSIAENIAYGRPGATGAEIIAAAKAANAHDFITRLPQGYETLVGERGMCLSGGERQRVSIARAFLKDAPILILDEPTSSVDIKTEAAIVEALQRLVRGRTTFVIAHRTSTLQHCDQILKIELGRVVAFEPRPSRPLPVTVLEDRALYV